MDSTSADLSKNYNNEVPPLVPVVPVVPVVPPPDMPNDDKKTKKKPSYLPLIIYLVLNALTLVVYIFSPNIGTTFTMVLFQLVWILIFAFIIYALCKSGHEGWAWVVLLFPLIITVIILILFFFVWIA